MLILSYQEESSLIKTCVYNHMGIMEENESDKYQLGKDKYNPFDG